jgi:hypothetical protein
VGVQQVYNSELHLLDLIKDAMLLLGSYLQERAREIKPSLEPDFGV